MCVLIWNFFKYIFVLTALCSALLYWSCDHSFMLYWKIFIAMQEFMQQTQKWLMSIPSTKKTFSFWQVQVKCPQENVTLVPGQEKFCWWQVGVTIAQLNSVNHSQSSLQLSRYLFVLGQLKKKIFKTKFLINIPYILHSKETRYLT